MEAGPDQILVNGRVKAEEVLEFNYLLCVWSLCGGRNVKALPTERWEHMHAVDLRQRAKGEKKKRGEKATTVQPS